MQCPKCSFQNPENAKFCMECGHRFSLSTQENQKEYAIKGERKQATVLFSDLSGYTAMTEKMDPEDVKNLMEDIFEKAGKIVEKYEGTVDSFFGDEILILFGVPKTNEDDSIRAIHTAIEIHKLVADFSPEFEKRNNCKLSMHSGINSGLVITGDKFIGKGRQGLAGDTINLASRLTSIAKPGEIVVGQDTFKIAENHFYFESCDPVQVKGKKNPVQTYKVIDATKKPVRTKQLHGVRAELIGRDKELSKFNQTVNDLKKGKGSVLCLYGFAGTGKSRLIEEFKLITNVQWFEGYSYPYTKNIPYFPLLALFDDIFSIKEEDSQKTIKTKIEESINNIIKDAQTIIPYIDTLYSLSYPEVENVSPEFWKSKLLNSVLEVLLAISKEKPIILCIEDLHWADPSFIELIQFIHSEIDLPILFLYVSRPIIQIFSSSQIEQMETGYQEVKIADLSISDSQAMVKSLLNSDDIPLGLKDFIETKTQGNPFYLEEIINSLIESRVLLKNKDTWVLQKEITSSDVSSSIHGVISARVDRLEIESKRILQEASVIGRSFYYEIINKITEIKKDVNQCLKNLEGLDLIKSSESKIDLEYIFKHALTQEVVYKGLLKAERQVIHERIGIVIEEVFKDRLPEFYETLAHHFSKGKSNLKAVDYLMKSGDKSTKRYSIEEAHQYFQKAFDFLNKIPEKTQKVNELLLDLVNRWALVFYYKGDFINFGKLMSSQEYLIESTIDKAKVGMFYAWQGNIFWMTGQLLKAQEYLLKAEKIGIEINNKNIIGYACSWYTWLCAELGLFEKSTEYGLKTIEIGKELKEDPYIYFKSLGGLGCSFFYQGYSSKSIDVGEQLIDYGDKYSQIRCLGMGYCMKGAGLITVGNYPKAITYLKQSLSITADPLYSFAFTGILSIAYVLNDNMRKAENLIKNSLLTFKETGCEVYGDIICKAMYGIVLIDKGEMSKGLCLVKDFEQSVIRQQRNGVLPLAYLILGKVYLEIIQQNKPIKMMTILKNIGFIIANVPSAYKKSIFYYGKAIDWAERVDAIGIKAQAHLDIGIIHKSKNENEKAKEHLEKAISIFEKVSAVSFLKRANSELNQLTQ